MYLVASLVVAVGGVASHALSTVEVEVEEEAEAEEAEEAEGVEGGVVVETPTQILPTLSLPTTTPATPNQRKVKLAGQIR